MTKIHKVLIVLLFLISFTLIVTTFDFYDQLVSSENSTINGSSVEDVLTHDDSNYTYSATLLNILDSYPSLESVKVQLSGMRVIANDDAEEVSALDLLANDDDPNTYTFKKEDRMYFDQVLNSLQVEVSGMYPWSLRDYSEYEIATLFTLPGTWTEGSKLLTPENVPGIKPYNIPVYRLLIEDSHSDGAFSQQVALAKAITKDASTHQEAIGQLAVWMEQNFFHAYDDGEGQSFGWERYLDGKVPHATGAVAYPASVQRVFEERIIGCHEPSILLETMLHGINIPALIVKLDGHGLLYLPSIDKFIHGDRVAMLTSAPAEAILATPEELSLLALDSLLWKSFITEKYPYEIGLALKREGNHLIVRSHKSLLTKMDGSCKELDKNEWHEISSLLSSYDLHYIQESGNCRIESDPLPIMSLEELVGSHEDTFPAD